MNSAIEILFVEWVEGKPYSRWWLLNAKERSHFLRTLQDDLIRTEAGDGRSIRSRDTSNVFDK